MHARHHFGSCVRINFLGRVGSQCELCTGERARDCSPRITSHRVSCPPVRCGRSQPKASYGGHAAVPPEFSQTPFSTSGDNLVAAPLTATLGFSCALDVCDGA